MAMEFIGYSSCCKWLYCLTVGLGLVGTKAVALGCRLDARSWSICNIVVTDCNDLGTTMGYVTVAGWVVSIVENTVGMEGYISLIGALCHQYHYDGVDGLEFAAANRGYRCVVLPQRIAQTHVVVEQFTGWGTDTQWLTTFNLASSINLGVWFGWTSSRCVGVVLDCTWCMVFTG